MKIITQIFSFSGARRGAFLTAGVSPDKIASETEWYFSRRPSLSYDLKPTSTEAQVNTAHSSCPPRKSSLGREHRNLLTILLLFSL